jgi:hypothetical protein
VIANSWRCCYFASPTIPDYFKLSNHNKISHNTIQQISCFFKMKGLAPGRPDTTPARYLAPHPTTQARIPSSARVPSVRMSHRAPVPIPRPSSPSCTDVHSQAPRGSRHLPCLRMRAATAKAFADHRCSHSDPRRRPKHQQAAVCQPPTSLKHVLS